MHLHVSSALSLSLPFAPLQYFKWGRDALSFSRFHSSSSFLIRNHFSSSIQKSNESKSIEISNEAKSTEISNESKSTHKTERRKHFIASSPDEELKFMEYMGAQLGFKDMSAWYKINTKHFQSCNGNHLLQKYHHSPSGVVMSVFKDHQWLPWKFGKVPEGFWDDKNNQVAFLKYLEGVLGYTTMDDWYGLHEQHFIEHGGRTLLQRYMSPRLVLKGVMGDHEWVDWRFKTGFRFWDDMANQRAFLEYVGQRMGFVSMSDWYAVKGEHIIRHGGVGLLSRYRTSPSALVMAVFHTHPWETWRFRTLPLHLLTTPRMLRAYFDALAPRVGVTQLDAWREVSFSQLQTLGPCWHVKRCGLMNALRKAYPEHAWPSNDNRGSIGYGTEGMNAIGSSQHLVASLLRKHLPGMEVLENFKHTSTPFDHSGMSMSIDIFVPSLSLGLEYNGGQHYQDIAGAAFLSASNPKKHDVIKLKQFLGSDYTFIHLPWWWDGKFASLQAIIQSHRPDIQFQLCA